MFRRPVREMNPDPKRELIRRFVITLVVVGIYHVGLVVPAPSFALPAGELTRLVDTYALLEIHNHLIAGGGLYIGVGFFALGFLPFLQAEALVAILQVVVPRLRYLARDGEYGRRKLRRLTTIFAIALAVVNAAAFAWWIEGANPDASSDAVARLLRIVSLSIGSLITLYLVKLLNDEGLGKGIPVLLTSNVMSGAVSGTLGGISVTGASLDEAIRIAGQPLSR